MAAKQSPRKKREKKAIPSRPRLAQAPEAPVAVVNLIAEDTIKHAMLGTRANKMTLAEGVLDGTPDSLANAKLKRGREANLARLKQMLNITDEGKPAPKAPPADPAPPSPCAQPPPSAPRSSTARKPSSPATPPRSS